MDFILTGRVLICLFLFFATEYIIIPILNSIAYLPVFLVTKIKVEIDRKDFRQILHLLGIVKFKKGSEIPVPGKNIDILYDLSALFAEEGIKDEVNTLKNSVIQNVWNVYFTFSVVYFFILRSHTYGSTVTTIVIIGLILIVIVYGIINGFFEYMLKNYEQLIAGLSFIKLNNSINTILGYYGIYPVAGKNGLGKFQTFEFNNKEYVLVVPKFYQGKVADVEIQRLLTKRGKEARVFILIVSNDDFSGDLSLLSLTNHDSLIMIKYSDQKNLEAQLKQTIESITQ
jgi:hypothetical protein